MFNKNIIWIIILILMVFSPITAAEKYVSDTAHSSISFTINHMVVSKVRGDFTDFNVEMMYDEKEITKSSVMVTIKTASIDTRNEKRDEHLKTADFFDVEKYPQMTFKSTGFKKEGDKQALVGMLTMHGVSKEVVIPFNILGKVKDPWGGERLGIEGFTILNRKDFGLDWNKTLDKGGLVLGEQVTVEILLEMTAVKDSKE